MAETMFEELKRYVCFEAADEAALTRLHPIVAPHFHRISEVFYRVILQHEQARTAMEGGESQVGRLKGTLVAWMDKLFAGPWDEEYYERRARIGRVHVRIALPQHYMFGAMNVLRLEMADVIDRAFLDDPEQRGVHRTALHKILDLELAIMLHTYREDLLAQQARIERLSTFGQLVASIGHELRNPLGVIETSLYLLRGKVGDEPRADKHLTRIGQQVQLANDIVTQLLDMIRDSPLDRQPCALAPVVRGAAEAVSRPAGVSLALEGLESLPPIQGDARQLRQVFVNLVENAVHAASPQGQVVVLGRELDDEVEVAVEDSGGGVDPAVKGRLFEPLVTTKQKGIGLGLALVKRIVERHQGSIRHRPAELGGACFAVRFPKAPPEAPAAEGIS
jgi:two-component system, NtrC family, sensor histidine kinase HydH